jgi:HD-GYP domain-containing protein (c-di-GMP phosphodiesterase class II)
MHDPYGVSHGERVAELTLKLAERSGKFDKQEMHDLELAGYLHDIGKIGLPESIRRNPGRLNDAERAMVELHPVLGDRILAMVMNGTINKFVRDVVKHHHENWDGSGYPDGLKGEDIPLGSRMIRVCDFYDALTHVRGYAPAKTPEESIEYMVREQTIAKWADPIVLGQFVAMMKDTHK